MPSLESTLAPSFFQDQPVGEQQHDAVDKDLLPCAGQSISGLVAVENRVEQQPPEFV